MDSVKAELSLNPTKSQHLRLPFRKSSKIRAPNGGSSIDDHVSHPTCSGVIIDNRLNRTAQVDVVTAKCKKGLHAIRAFFKPQLGVARQLLYKSMVCPVTAYASSVWCLTTKQLHRQLEQVHKDFLKTIRLSKAPSQQHDSDSRPPDRIGFHQRISSNLSVISTL